MSREFNIVGAGLAGALLAVLLARSGARVHVFERRPDPRRQADERGRSINLALAMRGVRALEAAGLLESLRPLLIPMRGRMVHAPGAAPVLHPYGLQATEYNWSVSRAALNRALVEAAARTPGVALHFDVSCLDVDLQRDALRLRERSGAIRELPLRATIATDGAGSAVRASLEAQGLARSREDWLDHDYKELTIAPAAGGGFALEPEALHIWPREGFMLIALPNTDHSFTATLFLARDGAVSFATLQAAERAAGAAAREAGAAAVHAFFAREFPDALALMPQLEEEFAAHPQGRLATLHCAPWHVGGRVLLLGDAAHAIVPFHGQGMNAAFEDCVELTGLLGGEPGAPAADTARAFAEFERIRRPDAEAIARMALENYGEMRAAVLDPAFLRRRSMGLTLERSFPGRFVPRYSMVMFHPEIRYSEALRRGAIQEGILAELDAASGGSGVPDLALAERLINERLVAEA